MNTKEKIEVMQAWVNKKPIQFRVHGCADYHDWCECDEPVWDWNSNDYRIKPEPLTRWVVIQPKGMIHSMYGTEDPARRCLAAISKHVNTADWRIAQLIEADK